MSYQPRSQGLSSLPPLSKEKRDPENEVDVLHMLRVFFKSIIQTFCIGISWINICTVIKNEVLILKKKNGDLVQLGILD